MDGRDEWGGTLGRVLRAVASVVLGGGLGAAVWVVIIQEEIERGWGDHDFLRVAGNLLGGTPANTTKRGFLLAVLASVVVALAATALEGRLPRGVIRAGLIVGAAMFLLWGVVFCLIAASRVDEPPSGLFGLDGGIASLPSGLVASAAAGIVMVRVIRMCADAHWWRPGREPGAEDVSFELAEERLEQGAESPR